MPVKTMWSQFPLEDRYSILCVKNYWTVTHIKNKYIYLLQSFTIVKITSPKEESCSVRTSQRRVQEMGQYRELLSKGSPSSLLQAEVQMLSKEQRQALLQEAGE